MVTPPAIPANDGRPSLMRVVVLSTVLLALVGAGMALFLSPLWPAASEPATATSREPLTPSSAGETCLRLSDHSSEYLSEEAIRRRTELRIASCGMALAAQPENTHFKVAVARAMPHAQRAESLAVLREAAAQDDAQAYYEIYESHKSWDRGDLDKAPLVPRGEADHALRKAADLGHPYSTQMLAVLLDRGGTVKRDPAAARYWAERAVNNPANDESRGNLLVLLGRLLVKSDKPDERARGLDLLERLSKARQFGAKTQLALAIRNVDPVRARSLLEESRRPDPGGAIPPLAEMLIAGDGGPAEPQRALSLLKAPSDTVGVKGVLGHLYLEGKLVPRDVQQAVRLIGMAGQWDLDARLQVLRLLAVNPETRVEYPKRVIYDAAEAAELDEPGAMSALIDLKLSQNAQFQDKPGACKLIGTAVKRGDQTMAPRLAECRAN
jgi:TPR repeat protein